MTDSAEKFLIRFGNVINWKINVPLSNELEPNFRNIILSMKVNYDEVRKELSSLGYIQESSDPNHCYFLTMKGYDIGYPKRSMIERGDNNGKKES